MQKRNKPGRWANQMREPARCSGDRADWRHRDGADCGVRDAGRGLSGSGQRRRPRGRRRMRYFRVLKFEPDADDGSDGPYFAEDGRRRGDGRCTGVWTNEKKVTSNLFLTVEIEKQ